MEIKEFPAIKETPHPRKALLPQMEEISVKTP